MQKVVCELYNDHFENAKRYQLPRAQLIIAISLITLATMLTPATPDGIMTVTTKTVRAVLQENISLTQTTISRLIISLISALVCLKKSRKKRDRPLQ